MMEGTFYQQKNGSPTTLAVVLLVHGAALTALALAKGEEIRRIWEPPIVVETYPENKAPPPEPPKPREEVVQPRDSVITRVEPDIKFPPFPDSATEWKEAPAATFPDPGPIVLPPRAPVIAEPPKARKVEPARARTNLASYVSDEDYPTSAVRSEEQGTTRFRLGVGPDGHVTNCTVTASSGSSALDSTTCRLMKQRARFTPALDSDGRPTSDSVASAIRWVLPD
ncbi:MAG: periplasmic protein TonB [Sphingomonadales bacterium]|jgi:protein TonB|nr:periplasmic protein TonB [Sphingomonadales bacterium]